MIMVLPLQLAIVAVVLVAVGGTRCAVRPCPFARPPPLLLSAMRAWGGALVRRPPPEPPPSTEHPPPLHRSASPNSKTYVCFGPAATTERA